MPTQPGPIPEEISDRASHRYRSPFLDKILARTRADLAQRIERTPRAMLEQQALRHTPRGFAAALRTRASNGPAVIAELKKASPSKGLIRTDFSAAALAPAMQEGGAAAL